MRVWRQGRGDDEGSLTKGGGWRWRRIACGGGGELKGMEIMQRRQRRII